MARFLDRPFQRWLRTIGAQDKDPQILDETLKGVAVVGDYSDVAPPHQNPLFGCGCAEGAQVGLFSTIEIQATRRPIRLTSALVAAPSPGLSRYGAYPSTRLTVITAEPTIHSLGPNPNDTPQAVVRNGTTAVDIGTSTPFWIPDVDLQGRPRIWLLQPGAFLAFQADSVNTTLTMSLNWEELPHFDEITDDGYPS